MSWFESFKLTSRGYCGSCNHAGFLTDWQQPFTLVLTQCEGSTLSNGLEHLDRGYENLLAKPQGLRIRAERVG